MQGFGPLGIPAQDPQAMQLEAQLAELRHLQLHRHQQGQGGQGSTLWEASGYYGSQVRPQVCDCSQECNGALPAVPATQAGLSSCGGRLRLCTEGQPPAAVSASKHFVQQSTTNVYQLPCMGTHDHVHCAFSRACCSIPSACMCLCLAADNHMSRQPCACGEVFHSPNPFFLGCGPPQPACS